MSRIVSLLPAATEIVCALGRSRKLVGRSHECDHPPEILNLPACSSPRIDPSTYSGEINRQVEGLLRQGLSIFEVDKALLKELRPDLILTQTQCEVCAVSPADIESALAEWTGTRPRIISLSPHRLVDVWENIKQVAEALGVEDRAKDVLRALHKRVADVIEKMCMIKRRRSILCLEWLDPLMVSGNWVPELVDLAGGTNVFSEAGKSSRPLTREELLKLDPDVIVAMPCGFNLERTRNEIGMLADWDKWRGLRAVKRKQVYLVDGNHHFNRPGPRLVDSLEILSEILLPSLFEGLHEGKGWLRGVFPV